ncbi:MAG: hypothetical protein BWZ00_01106 [Bacteroidetes bacterium ADurb.BinA174]|nr:MAG: hypothetical protein BWZ00_01106 [Bacteroidetes bacterium ADurb.BinA174]
MFTKDDLALLQEKNISEQQIDAQLNYFKNGFPFLNIVSAASVEKGVLRVSEAEEKEYLTAWQDFLKTDKKVTKFVPASGAASRMFKDLFAFADADYDVPETKFEKTFFDNIEKFAFYDALDEACKENFEKTISELIEAGNYKAVVRVLLSPDGLNYGNLPKGLLLFHSYDEGNRTPVGEHMTEGTLYARDKNDVVNIHFTVSEEHKELFELLVAARKLGYELKLGAKFDVSYSVQKPNTDTIAVDMENNPFREDDGSLLFRPGGHGALIENLNDIDSDIIFIKNIDNVVPDRLKESEALYKKLLGGVLVKMQQRTFGYLNELTSGKCSSEKLQEILKFTENELCIASGKSFADDEELKNYLIAKLDRPFRVCGMVKNVGEPGGGPFIAENPDGTASLQILESSQIDKNDAKAVDAFKHGSHFNPVDLVCGVKSYKNNKFDLTKFVDKNTGFISQKSKNGKDLKALELPGLWNGAMSDWNTIFVEVPISTFNPVKTVNDLLRPEHQ